MEITTQAFTKGTHNLLDDEIIPADAAKDSKNFTTKDGAIELVYGRKLIGTEGLVGEVRGLHYGYKTDGTKVLYRKINTKIQYFDGTTWQDVITGLTDNSEYSFSNYSSNAGAFTYISGIDGFYKINNANPGSYISLYVSGINDKGKILIDKARLIMWDAEDTSKSALLLSHIDEMNYTTVTQEFVGAAGSQIYNGTLGFKTTGDTKSAFGVLIAGAKSTPLNIISASQAADGVIGFEDIYTNTWIAAGDRISLHGISGMVELNDRIASVVSTTGTTITIDIATTTFAAYAGPNGGQLGEVELLTDDKDGTLSSDDGGTGTINYTTGAYTTDFVVNATLTPVIEYSWEDSNSGGLSDFRYSSTRAAGEGNIITQDIGGDNILNVLLGQDGKYYSLKSQSSYQLDISAGTATDFDKVFTNLVYRRDIGIPYWRAAISTSKGIVFMNTANPDSPEMTILQRNPLGDNIEPVVLFPHYDFSKYDYDECCIDTWERYILVACKTQDSTTNNVLLLCDMVQGSVDMTNYGSKCFAKDSGNLYVGSPLTQSTYQVFNGFDDDGVSIDNYWISKGEKYFKEEVLKRFRKLIFKGEISRNQIVSVYVSYDDGGFALAGQILGSGTYVDIGLPRTIGGNMVGTYEIGMGEGSLIYPYLCEIKVPRNKFRKRNVKFVADEIGYFSLKRLTDWDIIQSENRIPKRYRTKQ
jgi:hypothetical protein